MASPPETNVLKVPEDFFRVAVSEPRPRTVDCSLSHFPPVTVESAVTRTLLVRGSTAQEVPGMVAFAFSVRAAAWSSAVLLSTWRTTAPAFFAWTTTLSSPLTTLTTSCCLALS
ncbi:hypothetical protein GCM10018980_48930 [Streptomyces capoamus]|uniref:Uncharacterized protein n=1 Tax=Streptomyces capoamus TaxID=68183 RepID=A0A919EYK7_9ACTN|nr:hypothetical protein GCM10018980_48930 [Streptomyces capoamus]